jgi:lipoyl(octanoyl) transferase
VSAPWRAAPCPAPAPRPDAVAAGPRVLLGDNRPIATNAAHSVRWAYLGRVEYGAALGLQRALLDARAEATIGDTLLLVEHPPVLTFGRRDSRSDVLVEANELAARGIAVHETNRGGLVTYHGPGQLVGYPIVGLRALTGGDVVRYVCGLEETLIRVLAGIGIASGRDPVHRGVWVEPANGAPAEKIAAIGVAVSRGVAMHGFALNVQPALEHFALIRPCGIADRSVTSIAALLGRRLDFGALAAAIAECFGQVFSRAMVTVPPSTIWEAAEG